MHLPTCGATSDPITARGRSRYCWIRRRYSGCSCMFLACKAPEWLAWTDICCSRPMACAPPLGRSPSTQHITTMAPKTSPARGISRIPAHSLGSGRQLHAAFVSHYVSSLGDDAVNSGSSSSREKKEAPCMFGPRHRSKHQRSSSCSCH
jgi:hypothetical protein